MQQPEAKLVVKRVIKASRERVFEAWTNPRMMEQWLYPNPKWSAKSSNDLRIGGSYNHVMISDGSGASAENSNSEVGCASKGAPGQNFPHTGEYIELVPPERIVFSWSSLAVKNTRVTVELRDIGDSTELTLIHELLPSEVERNSHSQGWTMCLENLSNSLEN